MSCIELQSVEQKVEEPVCKSFKLTEKWSSSSLMLRVCVWRFGSVLFWLVCCFPIVVTQKRL